MGYIDTRDLAKRLEELEDIQQTIEDLEQEIGGLRDEGYDLTETMEDESLSDEERQQAEIDLEGIEETIEAKGEEIEDYINDFDKDEYEELKSLSRDIPEWRDGNTLIPERDWIDYVRELLVDCGDLPSDIPWYIEIDWEATAKNVSDDYGEVTYQGETYFYRL